MPNEKTRCERIREWIGSPTSYIYLNYFLSSWGDRMWNFAVALYLMYLAQESLRLAAIFGFSTAGSVLLFGGIIGNWVDNNKRLKVVRIALFLQNTLVMLSALSICIVLYYEKDVTEMWNGCMMTLAEAIIVILAVLAQLASVAYKIAIEKDWIVVIAAQNKSALANLNATSRSIDLTCKLLAPTLTGLIMVATSLKVSAMMIAGWNIVSMFLEYGLLSKVYKMVPRLATKGEIIGEIHVHMSETESDKPEKFSMIEGEETEFPDCEKDTPDECSEHLNSKKKPAADKEKKAKKSCLEIMFEPFLTLAGGWKTYAKQSVLFAGISLALLYMTVMGFDSITLGYIYAQGVNELVVGIAMALAGLTGIIGTIVFTRMRKRVGLERTGLFAFSLEICLLSLCVVAIFVPGSSFAPHLGYKDLTCSLNVSDPIASDSVMGGLSSSTPPIVIENMNRSNTAYNNSDTLQRFVRSLDIYHPQQLTFTLMEAPPMLDAMAAFPVYTSYNQNRYKRAAVEENSEKKVENSGETRKKSCYHYDGLNISVILFITGIVASRIGLWMADLVVTQLLQENVQERERGVVNGVQNSLNMLMDLLKFTLVIMVPQIHLFGFLIIISFIFIFAAGCFFAFHSWRVGGHLFHFNKLFCSPCCSEAVQVEVETNDDIYKPSVNKSNADHIS